MVKIILYGLFTAWSAWGSFAGIIIISPFLTVFLTPEIVISASPSIIWTIASKGAECSDKPWPWSNAKKVTVPNSFLITTEKVAVEAGIIDYADTNINVEDAVKWITKE